MLLRPIAANGRVRVATSEVVKAQLLKQAIEVENFNSDPEALLDATVKRQRDLVKRAAKAGAAVNPKALYVVEKSNPVKGQIVSRPLAIWEYLREQKVAADQVAVYTDTKILPDGCLWRFGGRMCSRLGRGGLHLQLPRGAPRADVQEAHRL